MVWYSQRLVNPADPKSIEHNGISNEVCLRPSSCHRDNSSYQLFLPTFSNALNTPTTQPRGHPAVRPSAPDHKHHRRGSPEPRSARCFVRADCCRNCSVSYGPFGPSGVQDPTRELGRRTRRSLASCCFSPAVRSLPDRIIIPSLVAELIPKASVRSCVNRSFRVIMVVLMGWVGRSKSA